MQRAYADLVEFPSLLNAEAANSYATVTAELSYYPSIIEDGVTTRRVKRRSLDIEKENAAIESEIESSIFILSIQNDMEEEDFVPYSTSTWDRVTKYLRRLAIHAHSCGFSGIGVPEIIPAAQGAISLFWRLPDRQLLMTFPADASLRVSFYAKKLTRELSGRFTSDDFTPELIYWLTT